MAALHANQWCLLGAGLGFPFGANLKPNPTSDAWHTPIPHDPMLPSTDNSITGAGVTVAVLDSGIVPIPQLKPNILSPGADFVCDRKTPTHTHYCPDGFDPGNWVEQTKADLNAPPLKPSSWHGTCVASTIAANGAVSGVAPGAKILPVRCLGAGGRSFTFSNTYGDSYGNSLIRSINWACGYPDLIDPSIPLCDHIPDVINFSVGNTWLGLGQEPVFFCRDLDPGYWKALSRAHERGVLIVLSAGNENMPSRLSSPARYVNSPHLDPGPGKFDNILCVASSSDLGYMSSWSSYNDARGDSIVDEFYQRFTPIGITAPGHMIYTVQALGDREPTQTDQGEFLADEGYTSGTSSSAPIVSGTAALMIEARIRAGLGKPTPQELIRWLMQSAMSRNPQICDLWPFDSSLRKPGKDRFCFDSQGNRTWIKTPARDRPYPAYNTHEFSYGAGLIDISEAVRLAMGPTLEPLKT
ncbi:MULTISPECIES: S8 family serine peptidase [Streptomyces]|uniref:S8 family serine peptidase n=1 Tax=Streptomyces TaxID=1883 RepID=UPI00345C0018